MALINCPVCGRDRVSSTGRCPNPECYCDVWEELQKKEKEAARMAEMQAAIQKEKDDIFNQQIFYYSCPACNASMEIILRGGVWEPYDRNTTQLTGEKTEYLEGGKWIHAEYCNDCGHKIARKYEKFCSMHAGTGKIIYLEGNCPKCKEETESFRAWIRECEKRREEKAELVREWEAAVDRKDPSFEPLF